MKIEKISTILKRFDVKRIAIFGSVSWTGVDDCGAIKAVLDGEKALFEQVAVL